MFHTLARILPRRYQAALVVLSLGAAAGLGTFASSSQSGAETKGQVKTLAFEPLAGHTEVSSERNQPQSTATQVQNQPVQSGFAQNEMARLAEEKALVQPKPLQSRLPLPSVSSAGRKPQNGVPQAGSIAMKPPTPPHAPARRVRTAQAEIRPSESKR
jgi:predicted lysophospholipase L1 biosynthesis ABC-type transport system permease subunit